jgi:hypothetical protein
MTASTTLRAHVPATLGRTYEHSIDGSVRCIPVEITLVQASLPCRH